MTTPPPRGNAGAGPPADVSESINTPYTEPGTLNNDIVFASSIIKQLNSGYKRVEDVLGILMNWMCYGLTQYPSRSRVPKKKIPRQVSMDVPQYKVPSPMDILYS